MKNDLVICFLNIYIWDGLYYPVIYIEILVSHCMDPYCINQPVNQYHLIPPTQRSHSESRATSRRPCVSPVVDCTGPGQKLLRGENGWRTHGGERCGSHEKIWGNNGSVMHMLFFRYIYIYMIICHDTSCINVFFYEHLVFLNGCECLHLILVGLLEFHYGAPSFK